MHIHTHTQQHNHIVSYLFKNVQYKANALQYINTISFDNIHTLHTFQKELHIKKQFNVQNN